MCNIPQKWADLSLQFISANEQWETSSTQSPQPFPVQAVSVSCHNDHSSSSTHKQLAGLYCTDFRCNASPYILEAFQTSNMPARMFCCWILSRTGYEGCWTPRSLFSGKLKSDGGVLAWQWNRRMKCWRPLGKGNPMSVFQSPPRFLELPEVG